MARSKPHLGSQLRCLLAFAGEVARNAVAEVRWHRERSRSPLPAR